VWIGAAIVLIVIAYGPFLTNYTYNFVAPGFANYWPR
jgi:hypothetical protein